MISFDAVTFKYDPAFRPAVQELTLDVLESETLSIVGANGSGKSTLGRLANGLLQPSSGSVSVDGVTTENDAGRIGARHAVGMVFQNPDAGIVSASVAEDVAFALENMALEPAAIQDQVARILEVVGLKGFEDAHPLSLTTSGRARLGLAAAIVGGPRYLILDEATAYLDAADRAELLSAVRQVQLKTGMSVVLITHLMDEALAADRVVVMAEAEIKWLGTPQALFIDADRARSWRLEPPPLLDLQTHLRSADLLRGEMTLTPETIVEMLCRS